VLNSLSEKGGKRESVLPRRSGEEEKRKKRKGAFPLFAMARRQKKSPIIKKGRKGKRRGKEAVHLLLAGREKDRREGTTFFLL